MDELKSVVENVAAVTTTSNDQSCEDDDEMVDKHSVIYEPRTFRPASVNSERRATILPAYPLASSESAQTSLLLLSNVALANRGQLESRSYCGGHGVCPFDFVRHRYVESIDSFMINLYQDLFVEPSRLWKVPESLIDYNLSRLRRCMHLYTQQTNEPALASLDEWPIALEFFLQIDVDVFYMKTCAFRGARPRLIGSNSTDASEGIICEVEPTARYGMAACSQRNCFLCQRRRGESGKLLPPMVVFAAKQKHCFVNKYESFLNCDVDCLTSNVIYALTCPCGQCDFVGSTSFSFHDRMLKHRDENNRIVREFLIGSNNMTHILKGKTRTDEILANNEMLLYQHSPRCSLVLQLFLDNNPEYWCLVPMSLDEARAQDQELLARNSSSSDLIYSRMATTTTTTTTSAAKTELFEDVLRNTARSDEESIWLTKSVPKPPAGYRFSRRQIEEQIDFFKFRKDTRMLPSNLVDFYIYTIIAVLPDDCSHELRRFIEALFVTHAETRLNTVGRLTHRGPWAKPLDDSRRGDWCKQLVRQCPHRT